MDADFQELINHALEGREFFGRKSEGKTISAELLSKLMRSALVGVTRVEQPLRISDAAIIGTIDLSFAVVAVPLFFRDCRFLADSPICINFNDGQLTSLSLVRCDLNGSLQAERARISTSVDIIYTKLTAGISLAGGSTGAGVTLRRCVCLGSPFSADLDSVVVGGSVNLDNSDFNGEVRLARAITRGEFSAKNAKFQGDRYALNLAAANVGEGAWISESTFIGEARFHTTTIGGQLGANDAVFCNPGLRALNLDSLRTGGTVSLVGNKTESCGEVCVFDAQIGGNFDAAGIHIYNPATDNNREPRALSFDRARIAGSVFVRTSPQTRPPVLKGELRFPNAEIGGQLVCRGLTIEDCGPDAVYARGLRVARDAFFDGGLPGQAFIAGGTINLDASRFDQRLSLTEATLNGMPVSLSLVGSSVEELRMPTQARPAGQVNLARARIGLFEDASNAWPTGSTTDTNLILDGFECQEFRNPSGIGGGERATDNAEIAKARIAWLKAQGPSSFGKAFLPQPWVHLERRLTDQGYYQAAREIGVERRRLHRKATTRKVERFNNWCLDHFTRYGYEPWRAVRWSMGIIGSFWLIWTAALLIGPTEPGCGSRCLFVRTNVAGFTSDATLNDHVGNTYPTFSALGFSFDVFTPFLDFGYQSTWTPNTDFWQEIDLSAVCVALPADVALPWSGHRFCEMLQKVALPVGWFFFALYIAEVLIGVVFVSLMAAGFSGYLARAD